MNRVLLQLWVDSRPNGIERDGCSLHATDVDRFEFVSSVYSERKGKPVPESYEMVFCEPIEAYVEDGLFGIISDLRSIRIEEPSLRNLLSMNELIVKNEI